MTNWQPIETAPRDVAVLVYHKEQGTMTACFEFDDLDGWGWVARPEKDGGSGFAHWQMGPWLDPEQDSLSHWMPLPGPPEGK